MPRPQFSLKTLLGLTLVAAAFFAGMALDREIERHRRCVPPYLEQEASVAESTAWVLIACQFLVAQKTLRDTGIAHYRPRGDACPQSAKRLN
ncbi:MAG TPA: hypothetical protein VJ783_06475 [Pirellulales bacterium]|nr:hypothetical protein [Pirellulales bacterium]